jgi:hypothetical protein
VGLAVLVAACSSGAPAEVPSTSGPVATTPAVNPAPPSSPPIAPAGPLHVRWLGIRATNGCFFFSGPDGRDDKLVGPVVVDRAESANGQLTVKIATATFTGTYRDRVLLLSRHSTHEFNGAWKVTEEIHGKFLDGVLQGSYHYEECEAVAATCPGRCTIDADLAFEK